MNLANNNECRPLLSSFVEHGHVFLDTIILKMTPNPPDDDKCQIPMCNQTHFTYCPHCKLFVCIEHLNEHYSNYRQEYQLLLKESQQHLVSNKEFLTQVDQEKHQLVQFFNRQGQYYQLQAKYFSDKAAQITIRPQDCADLRYYLAQSSDKRSKLKKLFADIQQLIHDYDCQQLPQLTEGREDDLFRTPDGSAIFSPRLHLSHSQSEE